MTLIAGVTACSPEPTNASASADDDNRIECRIANAASFERFCLVERSGTGDEPILTVRKPDGGFRRFRLTDDGRGVVAADGAEQPTVTIVADDAVEVAIGGDVFRLPARLTSHPGESRGP